MTPTDLVDAVIATLGSLEGVQTCMEHPKDLMTVAAPAVLIEMVEASGRADAAALAQELPVRVSLCATICISSAAQDAERQARALAFEVALAIHQHRSFAIDDVEAALIDAVRPANLDLFGRDTPSKGFVSWQVEWSQNLVIADTVWSRPAAGAIAIQVGWGGGDYEPLMVSDDA